VGVGGDRNSRARVP
jgi:hypothetical protein